MFLIVVYFHKISDRQTIDAYRTQRGCAYRGDRLNIQFQVANLLSNWIKKYLRPKT